MPYHLHERDGVEESSGGTRDSSPSECGVNLHSSMIRGKSTRKETSLNPRDVFSSILKLHMLKVNTKNCISKDMSIIEPRRLMQLLLRRY